MPAIDSILSLAVQQGATQLTLGTDRAPRMFAGGVPKKLSIEETSEETLRHLLGPIFSSPREQELRSRRQLEFAYQSPNLGDFWVEMSLRDDAPGFDVVFWKGKKRETPVAPPPEPSSAPSSRNPLVPAPDADHLPSLDADLHSLIAQAVALRASDLHLRTGDPVVVRVDGRLQPLSPQGKADVAKLLGERLGAEEQQRLRGGRSLDLALEVGATGRVRANVYVAGERLCATLRLLPPRAPQLGELGLPPILEEFVSLPHGLLIVCGPTGSGKSTTLAALAQEALRRRSIALLTLEDPIEYILRPANQGSIVRQRQIGTDVRDFPTGLRDALREDPDMILIGEMRDEESIALALTAAETGHLVLTTLHSGTSASAIERVIDTYAPERQGQIRVQLADALCAVVSQRLLPRANGGGRLAVAEVLRNNHHVANLIREGRTAQIATAIQSGRKDGMTQLERSLAERVKGGSISLEAAREAAPDPSALEGYLRG